MSPSFGRGLLPAHHNRQTVIAVTDRKKAIQERRFGTLWLIQPTRRYYALEFRDCAGRGAVIPVRILPTVQDALDIISY
jgi:hypothetical protein